MANSQFNTENSSEIIIVDTTEESPLPAPSSQACPSTNQAGGNQHAGMLTNSLLLANARRNAILSKPDNASKKSGVWMWFTEVEEDKTKADCKICQRRLTCGLGKKRSTSSMKKHLQAQHSHQYNLSFPKISEDENGEQEKEESSETVNPPPDDTDSPVTKKSKLFQPTLGGYIESMKMWDINDTRAVKLHYAIGEMLAIGVLPYNFVENEGFQRFLSIDRPQYKVPGRTYFTDKIIPQIYKQTRALVQSEISHSSHISFTTDVWTSKYNNFSFISFTGHWLNQNFKNCHAVLNCRYFPGSHTGEAIQEMIEKMLTEWDINRTRVHLLIRDNGANIVKGTNDANLPNEGCFAHTLQLAYHDSIKAQRTVNDMISRARSIVGKFNHSSKNCTLLMDMQKDSKFPKKLIQDVTTRWNSTYYMLERLLELKSILGALSTEVDFVNLTLNEWSLLPGVLALLKPLEEVTKTTSSVSSIISEIIPNVSSLVKYYGQSDTLDMGLKTLKAEFLKNIKTRFNGIQKIDEYAFSTCLDPRYKLLFFEKDKKEKIKKRFTDMVVQAELFQPETTNEEVQHAGMLNSSAQSSDTYTNSGTQDYQGPLNITDQVHDSFWNCMNEIIESGRQTTSNNVDAELQDSRKLAIEAEINLYWSLESIPVVNICKNVRQPNDPRIWWKNHSLRLPTLQKYARKFLSAPSTSVYSERVFSEAGQIYDDLRTRLTPEHAETLLFIKHNDPLFSPKFY